MTHRIGIDLGGTKISGVVLDAAGNEVARARRPTPRDDYEGTLTAITELVAALESSAGLPPASATVGIGTPGTWQPRLEVMKNCNSTWLNDRPLLHDLERRLGERVLVANDADCLGISEATDGAGADAKSVFAVILGTGVGGAFVVRGHLVQGPNGLAGEWGHMPLPYFRTRALWERPPAANSGFAAGGRSHSSHGRSHGGPGSEELFRLESRLDDRRCYCGRMNCVETFLSGPGLAATHQALWGEVKTAAEIADAADERSESTLALYQHMLARSLAQVVNLIDPAVIVLGGGVSNLTRLYPAQESLIPAYVFSSVRGAGRRDEDVRVTVRRARWGDDSGVRGAAKLWEVKA
ncbi:MAG TPA: ROK family protein [Pseudomonadales bacterium]